MALKYSELAAFLVLLAIGFIDVFCATVDPKQYDPLLFDRGGVNQRNPIDPWDRRNYDPLALEGGINKPSPGGAGRRDFVATPAKPQQQNSNDNNAQANANKQQETPSGGNSQAQTNVNKQQPAQTNQGGNRDFVAGPKPNTLVLDKDKSSTTTPWPELGKRRNSGPTNNQPAQPLPDPVWVRPVTPAPKRDYVAPNPLLPIDNNQQYPSLPSKNTPQNSNVRDYVNPNPSNQNLPNKPQSPPTNNPTLPNPKPQSPTNTNVRDYVNPNLPQTPPKPQIPPQSNNQGIGKPNTGPNTPKGPVSFIGGTSTTTTTTTPAAAVDPKEKNRLNEDNELREFSEALLKKDVNSPLKYVTINYQGMTKSNSFNDEAPQPLLTISQDAYKIPSVAKLILLHNNYILESTQNEVYTAQEKIEENNFLDTILPTSVMQHTRNFLIQKGKLEKDPKVFRDLLKTIWFNMYSRGGGKIGSSGFEHVFLAEIKNGTVSGLHNYLYFKEEENKNKANYLGYMKKLEFEKGAILKYHFNFHDIDKPVGSMFVGTSPELEIALYSTCFIMRPNDVCPLRLAGKNFGIRTYSYRYRGKNMIGSAFPDI